MPRRIWVLPIAAMVIVGLCIYKVTREHNDVPVVVPDPLCAGQNFKFELTTQQGQRQLRLVRYLGRHRIFVVFYDGEVGAENNSVLTRLREDFAAIEKTGTKVIGISTAIPQLNRPLVRVNGRKPPMNQTRGSFPFELLTDLAPACECHRLWGRYDEKKKRPTQGTFFIDRQGRVACDGKTPKPLADPQAAIDRLLNQ